MLVGQSHKQKPKQWGPFNRVQSSLFHNLESIYGIDPENVIDAFPFWDGAGNPKGLYSDASIVTGGWGTAGFGKKGQNNALLLSDFSLNLIGATQLSCFANLTLHSAVPSENIVFRHDNLCAVEIINSVSGTVRNLIRTTGTTGWTAANDYSFGEIKVGKPFVTGFSWGNNKQNHFLDGDISPDYTVSGSIANQSGDIFYCFKHYDVYLPATLHQLFFYDGVFSQSQIAKLSDNPNAIWQRVAPVSFFFPVGVADDRIKFIPAFLNTTLTSNPKAIFIRNLETNIQSTTLTSTIDKSILRSILVDLSNTTLTSDAIISVVKTILVTLQNDTKTSDASINMIRSLISDLVNATKTTDIEISIQGLIKLLVSLQNNTSTTNIDVNIFRELFTTLLNTTSTTDIDVLLESIIRLQASFSNNTKTTDITSIMLRGLLGVLNNNTSTTDVNISYIIRLLTGLNNTTTTSDINIILSNFKSLVAAFSNATATTDIDVIVRRELVSNILNLTNTSALNVLKKINQTIKLENATTTTEISSIILRVLNVSFNNTTLTSDDIKIILSVLSIIGCDILSVQVFQDLLACVVSQDTSSCIVNCSKDTIN